MPRWPGAWLRTFSLAVVAAAGGLVAAAAFQPRGVGVALGGVVAGLWALRRVQGWRAGGLVGLAFGLGLFGNLLAWSLRFGVGAYVGLVSSQALFAGLAGAVVAARRRTPAAWVVTTTGVWVLAEALRSRWPLGGMEWGQFAHTTVELPVRSAAAVIGSLGLTGALIAVAAGMVVALEARPVRTRLGPLTVALLMLGGTAGLGALGWTRPVADVTVAVVQIDPICPGRPLVDCPDHADRSLQQFTEASATLPSAPDLLLWGEGAVSRVTPAQAGVELRAATGGLPAPLLAGVTTPTGDDRFYNRNVLYDERGTVVDSYAKRHPVPFGEYVPARRMLGSLGDVGRLVPRDLMRGAEPGRITTPAGRVGTVSSWELSFAREVRAAAVGGHALITLTSQASYGRDQVSDQLLAIARLRAAELGKPMVVAASTGRSAVLPRGGGQGPVTRLFARDELTATVTLAAGRTPFAMAGEALPVAAAILLIVIPSGARRIRASDRAAEGSWPP